MVESRRWQLNASLLVLLCCVGVGLPLWNALSTGSWGIPHNDDWDYTRAALTLHATGHVVMSGWGSLTLIGQLLLAQPALAISASVGALDATGLFLAGVLVIATWGLARVLGLSRSQSTAAAACVACSPLLIILAPEFMTDVPGAATATVSLWAGIRALRREPISRSWFAVSMAAGALSFAIRQGGAAMPTAVVLTVLFLWWRRRSFDVVLAGLMVAFALAAIATYVWRSHQPAQLQLAIHWGQIVHIGRNTLTVTSVAGLSLLPALAMINWRTYVGQLRGNRAHVVGVAMGIGVALFGLHLAWSGRLFAGNVASPWGPGAGDLLPGHRPLILNRDVWRAVQAVGAIATGIAVAVVSGRLLDAAIQIKRDPGAPRNPAVMAAVVAAALVYLSLMVAVSTTEGFDRYAVPLLPITAVVLLLAAPRAPGRAISIRTAAAVLSSFALLSLGLVLARSGAAYDAARWNIGARAVQAGIPARQIDVGIEWVGFNAPTPVGPLLWPPGSVYYEPTLHFSNACVVASNSESPPFGPAIMAAVPSGRTFWYDFWGAGHPIYTFTARGCP